MFTGHKTFTRLQGTDSLGQCAVRYYVSGDMYSIRSVAGKINLTEIVCCGIP